MGVVGLRSDQAAIRVAGVRLDDGSAVACDLVVDSTGRQHRSLAWLEQLGYERPPVSLVGIDTRYVSRRYRRVS